MSEPRIITIESTGLDMVTQLYIYVGFYAHAGADADK
jgi:hypothetical protein